MLWIMGIVPVLRALFTLVDVPYLFADEELSEALVGQISRGG